MGMAFLWLKYNLNYTKARALRVTILLGYVEITITIILYHNMLHLSIVMCMATASLPRKPGRSKR